MAVWHLVGEEVRGEEWGSALVFGVNKNRLNECRFTLLYMLLRCRSWQTRDSTVSKTGPLGLNMWNSRNSFQPNITYFSSTPQETVQFSRRRLLTLGPFIRGEIRRISHKPHPLHGPCKRESTVSTRAACKIYQDVWILLWHDGIYMIYGIDRIYMI